MQHTTARTVFDRPTAHDLCTAANNTDTVCVLQTANNTRASYSTQPSDCRCRVFRCSVCIINRVGLLVVNSSNFWWYHLPVPSLSNTRIKSVCLDQQFLLARFPFCLFPSDPKVTTCDWQNVKIQELTNSFVPYPLNSVNLAGINIKRDNQSATTEGKELDLSAPEYNAFFLMNKI